MRAQPRTSSRPRVAARTRVWARLGGTPPCSRAHTSSHSAPPSGVTRQAPRHTVSRRCIVPTVARIGALRFFYSLENREPPHVHVERGNCTAKFWLSPVRLSSNKGFRSH
ncbi:MAG: DUF4160 domain-containing protein [Cryobacterium sp.]|nr:DUF4160 domain-containing protein [Cryobacterium sp.]